MSRWAAIDTAVRLQLAFDNKTIDYKKLYGTWPAGAAQAVQENYVEIATGDQRKFLMDVAARLQCDKPALVFAWRRGDTSKIFPNKLAMLVALIEELTDENKPI